MNAKEISLRLIQLVTMGQTGLVQLRATIDWLYNLAEEEVQEFYDTINNEGSETSTAVWLALIGNGLIPRLAPGMTSPLELTDDQQEYRYPERASEFLSLAYGAQASQPNAEAILKAVAESPARVPTGIPPIAEGVAFNSVVENELPSDALGSIVIAETAPTPVSE